MGKWPNGKFAYEALSFASVIHGVVMLILFRNHY